MNKRNLGLALLAASMIGLFGCSEQSPSGVDSTQKLNPECGRFGLSSLGKLEKRSAASAVQQDPQVRFNLGKIKGSSGFFFLLYNVGMTPITNVTLSIDNAAFSVFPTSMDTLIPGSDVGMLPVVKIAAFHGTPFDGVGNRPLLPKGKNKFILKISGNSKTASGADTVISLDAEMDLEALVMDMTIEGINGALDMTNLISSLNLAEFTTIANGIKIASNCYTSCVDDSIVLIRNSGNVPVYYQIFKSQYIKISNQYLIDTLLDSIVAPGNMFNLILHADEQNAAYFLIASGENAVTDPEKLVLNDNGNYCARIMKGTRTCNTIPVEDAYNAYLAAHGLDQCAKIWALLDYGVLIYGQSYNDGDSVVFVCHDLANNLQLTSFSGTKHALVQDNCYQGIYLNDFIVIMNGMLTTEAWKGRDVKLSQGQITTGGQQNWIVMNNVSLTSCNNMQ